MVRRARVLEIVELITHINKQLDSFQVSYATLSLKEKVEKLVKLRHGTDDLGVSVLHDSMQCEMNAKSRIEKYLLANVGRPVDGDELSVVSGISEYGRRIRELRVEVGYRIFTGASADSATGLKLRADQYLLTSTVRDSDSARRWFVANRIRKQRGGAKGRILAYFRENLLKIVTTEEIRYVAKSNEFSRRIRELRTEEGFPIATIFTGRPDLKPGEYVLLDANRVLPAHERRIPVGVQQAVYQRDANKCQYCGWEPIDWTVEDPRILELHHITEHVQGGENSIENLTLLCSRCHDEFHAGRIQLSLK